MNRAWIWLPALAVPLLLAGCGNDRQQQNEAGTQGAIETITQGAVNQPAASGVANAEASSGQEADPQVGEASADYPREINFDIDDITDPLVNEEMKTSLRDALKGIVNEDFEQFTHAFPTEILARANEFAFTTGGGISFTGVDEISPQSGGRVVMNVHYVCTTADGEVALSQNYWFMPDKEGKWNLVTID